MDNTQLLGSIFEYVLPIGVMLGNLIAIIGAFIVYSNDCKTTPATFKSAMIYTLVAMGFGSILGVAGSMIVGFTLFTVIAILSAPIVLAIPTVFLLVSLLLWSFARYRGDKK